MMSVFVPTLPIDLPPDVRVMSGVESEENGRKHTRVSGLSDAQGRTEIQQFYIEQLHDQRWVVSEEKDTEGRIQIHGQRGTEELRIVLEAEEGPPAFFAVEWIQ